VCERRVDVTIGFEGKRETKKRLHYLQGQLGGIERMLDQERPVKDIFAQLKAVEKGIQQALYNVLNDELRKRFAEALAERLTLCPGDCDDAERLRFLKNEFGSLEIGGLIDGLAWLRTSQRSIRTDTQSKEVKL
jgi:CsoR family transcriptional regulator, copper-sensing transcriptional repressor